MIEPDRGAGATLKDEVLRGASALSAPRSQPRTRGVTSDLSIDEALLLHSAGWEPVDLVFGYSITPIPAGVWSWGQGEIRFASSAHNAAVRNASSRLAQECAQSAGHGVVGTHMEVEVRPHHVEVALAGTAIRQLKGEPIQRPFISTLSGRDFVLLDRAGWRPVGLAFGASFVYSPRRSAMTALTQANQNVELTNATTALYLAREGAMERMQSEAIAIGSHGVVAVTVSEGPVSFARHAIGFTAWGTGVHLAADSHRRLSPQLVLSMNDVQLQFDAASLRNP